jgi:hypothetical protein
VKIKLIQTPMAGGPSSQKLIAKLEAETVEAIRTLKGLEHAS